MFDWDEHNVGHIARHGVAPSEAEEAMTDPARQAVPAYNTRAERRAAVVGETEAGRVLRVIYTVREEQLRVVTAADAPQHAKRLYRRSRP